MTPTEGITPKFYTLLSRSEELLATIKEKRATELVDWNEMRRLHDELSQTIDAMTAMVLPPSE
jgi:hypothetical protein